VDLDRHAQPLGRGADVVSQPRIDLGDGQAPSVPEPQVPACQCRRDGHQVVVAQEEGIPSRQQSGLAQEQCPPQGRLGRAMRLVERHVGRRAASECLTNRVEQRTVVRPRDDGPPAAVGAREARRGLDPELALGQPPAGLGESHAGVSSE